MSVVRVGSTSTYAAGWDAIFGGAAKRSGGTGSRGSKKAGRAAGKAVKRRAAAQPLAVKAARKARKKQAARKKR